MIWMVGIGFSNQLQRNISRLSWAGVEIHTAYYPHVSSCPQAGSEAHKHIDGHVHILLGF